MKRGDIACIAHKSNWQINLLDEEFNKEISVSEATIAE